MLRNIVVISIVLLFFGGCVNNDYSKISDTLLLTPNYSLPVGAQKVIAPKPISNIDLDSIVLLDTIQYSLTDLTNKREYIDWLMFRVESTNTYPAQVDVTADYYDNNGNFLGSFTNTTPLLLAKPNVDQLLGSTSQTRAKADYYLYDSDIDTIMNMDYIIITTTISDLTLSDALLANWDNFNIYTTVGIQAQIYKQK